MSASQVGLLEHTATDLTSIRSLGSPMNFHVPFEVLWGVEGQRTARLRTLELFVLGVAESMALQVVAAGECPATALR
jgi:hypothetical protein